VANVRSADAETLEESQLLLIPREMIQEICARVPPAARAVADSNAAAQTVSIQRLLPIAPPRFMPVTGYAKAMTAAMRTLQRLPGRK